MAFLVDSLGMPVGGAGGANDEAKLGAGVLLGSFVGLGVVVHMKLAIGLGQLSRLKAAFARPM